MLERADLKTKVKKEEFKKERKELGAALSVLQQSVRQKKLPVVILFEGWGAAGKGGLIAELIRNFDPRGFSVHTVAAPDEQERRRPFLWRHWLTLPARGDIAVLDRSWYQDIAIARTERHLTERETRRRMDDINRMERELTDGGCLIVKFFVQITKKEQKERFERLCADKNTAWRVTETDWKRNREYDKYARVFDEMLESTDAACAPWHVISGMDRGTAVLSVYRTVQKEVTAALNRAEEAPPVPAGIDPGRFSFVPMPKLRDVPLDRTMDREAYGKELERLQKRLGELHGALYLKKIPAVIVYEGWDAAGKGGNIRRLSRALDPRGYEVVPIAAPTGEDAEHHYLWRFWRRLPKDGHIAVFDRSWYGRVLVERVEGFCSPEEWGRAYREINEFERMLCDWGAVVLKFWLHLDRDEQLRRFNDRENTPSRRWKITEEDWRNREKWDAYEAAADDMFRYTSTDFAPWHIIPSQDKKYGRIRTLKRIADTLEDRLK